MLASSCFSPCFRFQGAAQLQVAAKELNSSHHNGICTYRLIVWFLDYRILIKIPCLNSNPVSWSLEPGGCKMLQGAFRSSRKALRGSGFIDELRSKFWIQDSNVRALQYEGPYPNPHVEPHVHLKHGPTIHVTLVVAHMVQRSWLQGHAGGEFCYVVLPKKTQPHMRRGKKKAHIRGLQPGAVKVSLPVLAARA